MDFSKLSLDSVEANKEWMLELSIKYGVKILLAIGLLFIGWMLSLWARNAIKKVLGRTAVDLTITKFVANMFRYLVLGLVLLSCLNVFGIKTTSIAAMLGAAGLAIGLALQGTLSNLAAGFMLLLFRPFKVGDFIEAGSESGTVEEIQIFSTVLKSISNIKITVPNSNIFSSTIKNYAGFPTRRVDVSVGVSYSADMDATRKALEQAVANTKLGLSEPASQVMLQSLGDSAVNWQVRLWCDVKDYWSVHEDMVYQVKTALDKAKIEIPFPQMDVHVKKEA
ncbi:MAG TPA: mechanosensitive ion channel [Oligoflexia bacterium]|nr:mechanosensitive ion channel [Oligoflexia bacterium]HMR25315.1 mechanosensitive ion channel [Oligoflexia bacterium]